MTSNGWQTRDLDEICQRITDGSHFSPTPVAEGYQIATVSNMRSDGIDWRSCARISKSDFDNLERNGCRPRRGDVLFSKDGSVGKVLVMRDHSDLVLLSSIAILTPKQDLLNSCFLGQSLKWSRTLRKLHGMQTGTAIKRVVLRDLRRLRLSVPPLSEQRKIAAILSSVDEAIERTKAVIDQVQVVKRGLMQELFTRGLPGRHRRFKQTEIGEVPEAWDVVSLAQSGATVTSGSRGWAKYYSDDGALFLRITNVARNTIRLRLGDVRHVALPKSSKEGKRTRVQTGDLIISITADLGMVGFIQDGIGEAYVSQHLALVRLPDDAIRPDFVGYFLATDIARNRFYRLNDAGAKAGLNLPAIMKLTVPKPPRDEQDMTVEVLTATEDRLAVEEKKLIGLAAVKSALMSVLLTGELRVTPDPEPA